MNILYYGFSGSGPNIPLAIVWFIIATVCFITYIITAFMERKISVFFIGLAMAIVFVILGVIDFSDARTPIIKATVECEESWKEIYNKYEFQSQEGEIYTFKVKDTTNEEWEAVLKEHGDE